MVHSVGRGRVSSLISSFDNCPACLACSCIYFSEFELSREFLEELSPLEHASVCGFSASASSVQVYQLLFSGIPHTLWHNKWYSVSFSSINMDIYILLFSFCKIWWSGEALWSFLVIHPCLRWSDNFTDEKMRLKGGHRVYPRSLIWQTVWPGSELKSSNS